MKVAQKSTSNLKSSRKTEGRRQQKQKKISKIKIHISILKEPMHNELKITHIEHII